MFYIRLLENAFISDMNIIAVYIDLIRANVGPGFMNAWNYYVEPY
jgi:hypothetical protein